MAVKLPIYMDNHATTPVDPRVLEAMLPYFTGKFGNAASRNHSFGWAGEEAVETSPERIAQLLGAPTQEVVFTPGPTARPTPAIKACSQLYPREGKPIMTSVTEPKPWSS